MIRNKRKHFRTISPTSTSWYDFIHVATNHVARKRSHGVIPISGHRVCSNFIKIQFISRVKHSHSKYYFNSIMLFPMLKGILNLLRHVMALTPFQNFNGFVLQMGCQKPLEYLRAPSAPWTTRLFLTARVCIQGTVWLTRMSLLSDMVVIREENAHQAGWWPWVYDNTSRQGYQI